MTSSYNKLTIIGHLGHDPQMRYLHDGTPLTTFDVAVNERRQVDGQRVQRTQWFHVTCYGPLADRAGTHLRQGGAVLVEGPLVARDYVGQAGQKRLALDVRAREVCLLDALPHDGGAALSAQPEVSAPSPDHEPGAGQSAFDVPGDLDLVPF